jgi:hypothetical protein
MAKQELNSLDRFRKQPGKLVLEEYSHCEVPAGCGGVVLRWNNPGATLLLTLYLYTPKERVFLLDGLEPASANVDLVLGPHILAVSIDDTDLSAGLLMFAAIHRPPGTAEKENSVRLLSRADNTWTYTLEPPPADWTCPGFDDRSWEPLIATRIPELDLNEFGAYEYGNCTRRGAAFLGLREPPSPPRGSIWIRKLFNVTLPE